MKVNTYYTCDLKKKKKPQVIQINISLQSVEHFPQIVNITKIS